MIENVLLSIVINAKVPRVWDELIAERVYYDSVVYNESQDKSQYNIKETFKTPLGKVYCDFRCINTVALEDRAIEFNLVKGSHLKQLTGFWLLHPISPAETGLSLMIEKMEISYPVPDMFVKPVMVKIINSRLKAIKKMSEAVVK